MISTKLEKFLLAQKDRMNALDKAEGYSQDPNSPKYKDEKTGKVISGLGILYENALSWLKSKEGFASLNDEFQVLEQTLGEDTLSTAAPQWTTTLMPLIRRMFHGMVAQDLVSIQPMTGPSTYIYWLNKTYTHTDATSGITAGQRIDQQTPRTYVRGAEVTTPIRELQMSLERKLVEAATDKLRADWSLEAEQDWRSQYKLDVEGEMVPELGDEVARELDRKLMDALIAGAAFTVNWNPTAYRTGDVNISLYRHAYEEEIYNAIIDAQTWIIQNKRGVLRDQGIQWNLIMNANNWARFAKLENYNLTKLNVEVNTDIGRRYVGTINSLFKVYIHPEMNDCYMLLTIKKDWKFAVGYYAPYIPLYTSPRYIINDDFTHFARGVMSRYAFGVVPETSTGTTNNGIVLINLCES